MQLLQFHKIIKKVNVATLYKTLQCKIKDNYSLHKIKLLNNLKMECLTKIREYTFTKSDSVRLF